jgi:LPXTG-motif cell wall-anchored protein
LDEGTYYLAETAAPAGYNALTEDYTIVVTPSYNAQGVLTGYTTGGEAVTEVENNTGVVFPETGGIGRTIFTYGGSGLMLAAGVVLVARKKIASGKAGK